MAWPTNTDLQAIDADVLTYGKADLSAELAEAKRDVIAKLKAEWWPLSAGEMTLKVAGSIAIMDEAKLNSDELQRLVMYRALSAHVYPQFSKKLGADGDSFSRRADFYASRFKDEWNIVTKMSIYDFNNDSQFTDVDRVESGTQWVKGRA